MVERDADSQLHATDCTWTNSDRHEEHGALDSPRGFVPCGTDLLANGLAGRTRRLVLHAAVLAVVNVGCSCPIVCLGSASHLTRCGVRVIWMDGAADLLLNTRAELVCLVSLPFCLLSDLCSPPGSGFWLPSHTHISVEPCACLSSRPSARCPNITSVPRHTGCSPAVSSAPPILAAVSTTAAACLSASVCRPSPPASSSRAQPSSAGLHAAAVCAATTSR